MAVSPANWTKEVADTNRGFLLTEDGDYLLTETSLRLLLDSNLVWTKETETDPDWVKEDDGVPGWQTEAEYYA